MTRNHVDFVEFKHHMNPKKYMPNIRMARSSDKKHLTEKFKARLTREELYQNTIFERAKSHHQEELAVVQFLLETPDMF